MIRSKGFQEFDDDNIIVGGIPVQFLPVSNDLTAEAFDSANEVTMSDVQTKILRMEHLMAIMFDVGRPKDYLRLQMALDSGASDHTAFQNLVRRHSLNQQWQHFLTSTGRTEGNSWQMLCAARSSRASIWRLSHSRRRSAC